VTIAKSDLPPGDFLPQTTFVENLLREVLALMAVVPDSKQRQRVIRALEPFHRIIVPSALGIEEVTERLIKDLGYADPLDAADILLDAAYDVDLNYATDAIEYHVNEYLSDKLP